MLICANALQIPLADESVQCVVTSPPYWGLRRYAGEQEFIWEKTDCAHHDWQSEAPATPDICTGLGLAKWSAKNARGGGHKAAKVSTNHTDKRRWNHAVNGRGETQPVRKQVDTKATPISQGGYCSHCGAWRGAFGLEPTVEMYVDHTIQILREIRRVLRKDGVVFWNIGDSYCSGAYSPRVRENSKTTETREKRMGKDRTPHNWTIQANKIPRNGRPEGLKPKDLVLMPARIALAAQADGWWVRSMIIWAKANPMPESVTDRPTDSYEHIIVLVKGQRYFWDADAVREMAFYDEQGGYSSWRGDRTMPDETRAFGYTPKGTHPRGTGNGGPKAQVRGGFKDWTEHTREVLVSRNMRNVWMFATQPYSGAHFATFPEELPRRCIKAASSEFGACRFCGAPWKRISKIEIAPHPNRWSKEPNAGQFNKDANEYRFDGEALGMATQSKTIGWSPTCRCKGQHRKVVPSIVLDPFGGSGTTGRVAIELNRTPVLLDVAYNSESSEHYADLARKRTTEVQRGLSFV